MFLDIDKINPSSIASIDDSGEKLTYGKLCSFCTEFGNQIDHRTLIFILSQNSNASLMGYIASLSNRIVPLLISVATERELYERFVSMYHPEYLWAPKSFAETTQFEICFENRDYCLMRTGLTAPELHDDLSLLLPTSGSTGSPKLVRHSYRNLEANAVNVGGIFNIDPTHRTMAALPIHYTMGRSVIDSHLKAGATLILCGKSLLDPIFWKRLKTEGVTSFTGVPYSYEIMTKMRFQRMDLPDLQIITQGGGKLSEVLFKSLALYAQEKGKKFIPTYGQTECSARMTYLPAEYAMTKTCSIGIAEPNTTLSIIDENGIETYGGEATGEMVFRGENVTMGYAICAEDLIKGDENNGIIHTGDIARRDADGCYYIIGRMKRFLKIFGLRIALDEIENLVKSTFFDVDIVCGGSDELLRVYITNQSMIEPVRNFIVEKTHLFHKNIELIYIDAIPRNEAGKVLLNQLK